MNKERKHQLSFRSSHDDPEYDELDFMSSRTGRGLGRIWEPGYLLPSGRVVETPLPLNTSSTHPIYVNWIETSRTGTAGKLGMTLCPGRKGIGRTARYERELESDFSQLKKHKLDVIVPLIEDFEFKELKITEYFDLANDFKFEPIWFPIRDGGTPKSIRKTRSLVAELVTHLRYGRNVVLHCKAGQGRTGAIAACVLSDLGYLPADAIAVVRGTRKGTVENFNQENFVTRFRGKGFKW